MLQHTSLKILAMRLVTGTEGYFGTSRDHFVLYSRDANVKILNLILFRFRGGDVGLLKTMVDEGFLGKTWWKSKMTAFTSKMK